MKLRSESPPELLEIRCFTDAAWKTDRHIAGLGWIVKDNQNRIMAQGSTVETRIGCALMAEAVAMREALTQATSRNINRFTMASDSQQLINLVKSDTFHLDIYGIMQDIAKFALDLEVSFVFISRSENEEADLLAKSTLNVVPANYGLLPV